MAICDGEEKFEKNHNDHEIFGMKSNIYDLRNDFARVSSDTATILVFEK